MAASVERERGLMHTALLLVARLLAAMLLAAVLWMPSLAHAQQNRQSPTDLSTNRPLDLAFGPLNIAETVYSWYILDVGADASLLVETEEGQRTIELWPLAIPGEGSIVGANARRYLRSLVGRKVQFAFREHSREHKREGKPGSQGVLPDTARPLHRAFSQVGVELVKRGLARYCPAPGMTFEHLKRMQERAQERDLGLWREGPSVACPVLAR